MSSVASSTLTVHSPICRFPKPRMPALQKFPDIVGDTVAITFVGYAVSVSLAMIYADKHGYSIHPNQVKCEDGPASFWHVKLSPVKLCIKPVFYFRSCWLMVSPTQCRLFLPASRAQPRWPPPIYWRVLEDTHR